MTREATTSETCPSRAGGRDGHIRYIRRIGDSDKGPTASADRDAVIPRAMGLLMEQYGCDAAEAFDILLDLAGRDPAGIFTIAALMLQRREQ